MPMSRWALSRIVLASESEPPAGRLNEIVPATSVPWWLTCVAVWRVFQSMSAMSGTMVSAAVLSALPLELPPLLFEIALFCWLATALALRALVLLVVVAAVVTAVKGVTPETVLCGICVCAAPLALPAAVLNQMCSNDCGNCQYCGATSITTKYWLIAL
jgi:hypothetical protein